MYLQNYSCYPRVAWQFHWQQTLHHMGGLVWESVRVDNRLECYTYRNVQVLCMFRLTFLLCVCKLTQSAAVTMWQCISCYITPSALHDLFVFCLFLFLSFPVNNKAVKTIQVGNCRHCLHFAIFEKSFTCTFSECSGQTGSLVWTVLTTPHLVTGQGDRSCYPVSRSSQCPVRP